MSRGDANMLEIRRASPLALAAALLASAAHPGRAEDAPCPHHAAVPAPPGRVTRSTHRYSPPAVTLLDQDGRSVPLAEVLKPGGPLAVNFIFTTCTTVCPVMSATFANVRRRLGADGDDLRMVSISIDPEHDRPAQLAAYARRFGADPRWTFYTGSEEDVGRVLGAFDALVGDKTNHRPITLLRRAGTADWIRVEGLAGADALARELRLPRAAR
jgi:protein SCO1/2